MVFNNGEVKESSNTVFIQKFFQDKKNIVISCLSIGIMLLIVNQYMTQANAAPDQDSQHFVEKIRDLSEKNNDLQKLLLEDYTQSHAAAKNEAGADKNKLDIVHQLEKSVENIRIFQKYDKKTEAELRYMYNKNDELQAQNDEKDQEIQYLSQENVELKNKLDNSADAEENASFSEKDNKNMTPVVKKEEEKEKEKKNAEVKKEDKKVEEKK